ncbi:MAG TPA: protein tyrosine phosphatase [Cytophagales bacterium]|nr:protein tyrosine phosphatase [Cytophagales bacterium]HCR52900.1 protein tyrosine phosphatase [Cytophagales bacterium]
MKVLFVCLGNICRSPLAEGIMKHKLNLDGLIEKVVVDSCGTSDYHIGDMPDVRTRKNAEKNGVKLSHLGRQLSSSDLDQFDFILAMDRANHQNILRLGNGTHQDKIKLMREFDPMEGDEVPDPYYGNEDDFQEVFEILDRSIDGFLAHLRSKGLL